MENISNPIAATTIVLLILALSVLGLSVLRANLLPTLIHNSVWLVSLSLFGFQLISYKEFPLTSWLALALGILSFNVGSWLGGQEKLTKFDTPPKLRSDKNARELLGWKTSMFLLLIYSVGFIQYLFSIHQRFGIEILFSAPEAIRGAKGISYLESVPLWARLMLYVGPLLFALLTIPDAISGKRFWVMRIFIMLTLIASFGLMLQRTNLFIAASISISAVLTRQTTISPGFGISKIDPRGDAAINPAQKPMRKQFKKNNGFLIVFIIGATALLSFQVIGNLLGKNAQTAIQAGVVSESLAASGFTSVYSYLTSGIGGFLGLTSSNNSEWPPPSTGAPIFGDYNPQTWGASFFDTFNTMFPILRPWNPIAPFIDVGIQTNVFTSLEPFYRDFREVGIVIGAFLIGFMLTKIYARRNQSPFWFWVSSVLLSTLFFVGFASRISSTAILASILLVYILSLMHKGKKVVLIAKHDAV